MPRLSLDADVRSLSTVRAFVREESPPLGADDVAVGDLVQAVDEWVTNILTHGYREGHGPVEVELAREGGDVVVRVRDRAPDFDPHAAPPFDASVPLEVRRPGGMGIHLIRTLMDAMERRPRAGGGNELILRRSGRTAATGGNR